MRRNGGQDPHATKRPSRQRPAISQRITALNRKLLGKHYASKYQTGGRRG